MWRGGRDDKALWQDQPPSKPSRQSQNPPAGYHRGGGGETKGENQHEMERWHNPQSREGGRFLAENAYQKRKQNNVHHKEKKTKHTVLYHCLSSQITLAAPQLGAEEGVGRTTKKTNAKNLQSRASV